MRAVARKEETVEIIGMKEIMNDYGLSRATATAYLNMKSCPTLPRKKNSPYKILRSRWEKWLEEVKK